MKKTNNFEWLEQIKKQADGYPEPSQYLLDRLYYAEKKNEQLQKIINEYNSVDKKIPIILNQETAAKFIEMLANLINERDENKLFEKIIYELNAIFGYDRAGLMFYNDDTGKIEGKCSIGLPEEYLKTLNISPDETDGEKMRNYVARCFSERKSIFVTDRYKERAFNVRMNDELHIYSTQYVLAPIYSNNKTFGVITVAVQPDNNIFMTKNELLILEFVSHQIGIIIENSILNFKIEKFYKDLILTFSNLVEFRDECTAGHCARMINYCKIIGSKLNLTHSEIRELELSAALHDIGKISTPDSILNKPGKLTSEEYEEIKKHSAKGAEIVSPLSEYKNVIKAIKHHHERWDGKGYPAGLAAEQIPFHARILSVIDSFDVMINDRPYKKALTIEEAKNELTRCAGSQFDTLICELVVELPEDKIKNINK